LFKIHLLYFTFTISQSEIQSCPRFEEDEDMEYENVEYVFR